MVSADQTSARAVADLRNPLHVAEGIWGARNRGNNDAAGVVNDIELNNGAVLAPVDDAPPRARPRHFREDPALEMAAKPPPLPALPAHVHYEEDDNLGGNDALADEPPAPKEEEEEEQPPNRRKHAEKVVQPIDAPSFAVERIRQKLLAANPSIFVTNPLLVWGRALLLLSFGLVCSVVFSEAAVTASGDLSRRLSAHPFYISFVIFPLAINISEFSIALNVAGRRRKQFTTYSFASLYNCATLNNLIGLGVFCLIVYTRGLTWTFSAETIATLITSCIVGLVASLVRTVPLWMGFPVAILYVASVVVFRFLEYYAKWT